MRRIPAPVTTACLIAGGTLAWVAVARSVVTTQDPLAPLNPLGLNRSPYGEVLAMGMQGPIDTFFHAGGEEHHHDHDHDHDARPATDHVCGPDCDHDHGAATDEAPAKPVPPASLRGRFTAFLSALDQATTARTNPKPASPAMQFYLRRQTEDRLRFAYQLDPAHYGNFNSYYFFLTHSQLGTRPELTGSALALAQETIEYCLERDDDPRPALTAAAAAQSVLEHLINDQRAGKRELSAEQLRQALDLVDHCLTRHREISARWDSNGNWSRLSELRRNEVRDRLRFVTKIRENQRSIVENLPKGAAPHQAAR